MTLLLYILRQLTVSTAFAVGALAFVVFPGIAVSAVQRLGGVSLQAVLTYIPLVGVELAPYLVSLGFLLGIVSTFGRLAADREWVAISMSGIHPFRTLIPGAILAVILGFGTHALLADVSPVWKLEQGNFRGNALLEAFRNLAPGRSELDLGPFYLGAVSRDGDAFVDVQIHVPRDDGKENLVLVAERAELSISEDELFVQLIQARTVKRDEMLSNAAPAVQIKLSDLITPRLKDPTRAKHQTSSAMRAALAEGELDPERELEYRFEIQRRMAVGATYLVFLLVGIPTGLWLRSGNQLVGMGAAAIYAFTYYILSLRLGSSLALAGTVPPALAAWTTNILGAAIGLVLTWKLVRR
ncbi:LptF/LptG family permease [Engelhardtia mirabilis]|uniref:Putative permease YjgP/YjgQ family protein n=1 Tax=Engelhardtia mirabilis TaxID=2528011 RepID=A0A518BIU5_9BACT|nr:putative permease YjgP/YjgQ family protein [Planctomycetes bacterium Pla133]QDV01226.1 putative permease YjgP/YjgQ family protein [Planctomycetes bacterium Pla86]